MVMSIAQTELIVYLKGETMRVFEICDAIESCCIWFEDHRGIEVTFNDILADITDNNGVTARVCIAEDGRETDDTLLLKINDVEITDSWEVIIKAELAEAEYAENE